MTFKPNPHHVYKPKGAKKRKSRLRANRGPVYVPTSRESQSEAATWLRRR